MTDVESRLVDRLEGGESLEEEVLPDEPGAVPAEVGVVGHRLHEDLAVPVDQVVAWKQSCAISNKI